MKWLKMNVRWEYLLAGLAIIIAAHAAADSALLRVRGGAAPSVSECSARTTVHPHARARVPELDLDCWVAIGPSLRAGS